MRAISGIAANELGGNSPGGETAPTWRGFKMRILEYTTVALCVAPLRLIAADPVDGRVDQYIANEMKNERIPGLALGVYRRGEIVKAQGYGLANVELQAGVKPETVFQSGSLGKQFTATAIMMLVEEGKIGLGDSVTKYLKEAPAKWSSIQIQNLLSHTSGLAEYSGDGRTEPGAPFDLRLDNTEYQLFEKIASLPVDYAPGEQWRYTNTNYVLLGMIIRKVTGEFYGDYLQHRIFQPLGMQSTRVISEEEIIPNRASGYRIDGGTLKNQEWVSPTFNTTADGALYFNVLDLARWDRALYTEQLLHRSDLNRMWTVFRLNDGRANSGNYGFAWEIDEENGHKVVRHGGAWQGFTCAIARYVDDGLTVAVLTNLDSGHSRPGRIASEIASFYVAGLGGEKK